MLPGILAFLVASSFVLLELITSEFPATYPLLLRGSLKPYIYASIYGFIGFLATWFFDELSRAGVMALNGPGLSSPWLRAILLGISVKALLHIRLFSVAIKGGQPFPVGIETVVLIFEPTLLRGIVIDDFNVVRRYVMPRSKKYAKLAEVRKLIKGSVPAKLPGPEKVAFLADIQQADTVLEAMELFVGFLGVRSFDLAFPNRQGH